MQVVSSRPCPPCTPSRLECLRCAHGCMQANIMKKSDGLFLESCQEVAKKYPSIKYEEVGRWRAVLAG
jgi:hypothetical protein